MVTEVTALGFLIKPSQISIVPSGISMFDSSIVRLHVAQVYHKKAFLVHANLNKAPISDKIIKKRTGA
jgi:hypothetical protein